MDQKALKTVKVAVLATVVLITAGVLLTLSFGTRESRLHRALAAQTTGVLTLPAGVVTVSSELVIPAGAHDLEIVGAGTVLRADPSFQGRALLVVERARNIRFREFSIDGRRDALAVGQEMVPPENALRVWYKNNGILVDQVEGFEALNLHFGSIVSFPILVSRSSKIRIHDVVVEDCGSKNARGRNNLTGGILIEEGSYDFEVRTSNFKRILGNGLWTHSQRTSQRLHDGIFAGNRFDTIGRDALQVGHATRIRVEDNTGDHIGYPPEAVDSENGGTPVAVDTAGNVDQSVYARNTFEEINGKCFDLDGFHDGSVRENHCTNRKQPQEYLFGHFGIVMNNTDPDVRSQNIEIKGNVIDGTKFGALFVMGSGHSITGNQFLHVNLAQCNEAAAQFGCIYKQDEPLMLESGIYLGRGVARMEQTKGNVIRGNRVSGFKMHTRCVNVGPGVLLSANTVEGNTCEDYSLER